MRGDDRRSDAELLAATSFEPEAFAVFYRRYERQLLGYLLARLRNAELAADLMAEIFAAVLEAAAGFDPGRAGSENASGWLFTIAHNTLLTSLRRGRVADAARYRLGMREPLALDDLDLERVLDVDTGVPFAELLADLPEHEREAVMARVLDERDYEDLAEDLGCSPLVARKRVSRGLSRMRDSLQAAGHEE